MLYDKITLKLNKLNSYRVTEKGVFFYTENHFKIFVKKGIFKKLIKELK